MSVNKNRRERNGGCASPQERSDIAINVGDAAKSRGGQTTKMAATASCSAPGKVLLAGGYLILDRPHAGAVIALDARFHTSVELVPLSAFASSSTSAIGGVNGGDDDAAKGIILVEVHSPQFRDVRVYRYDPGGAPDG